MKRKENQEKSATLQYRTRMHNKIQCALSGSVQWRNLSAIDITERYNLYSTSEPVKSVASKQQENFCKITKICLFETQ